MHYHMALSKTLRRLCYRRNTRYFVTCLVLACLLFYIAVTTSLVRDQAMHDGEDKNRGSSHVRQSKRKDSPGISHADLTRDELFKMFLEENSKGKNTTRTSSRLSLCNHYNLTEKYNTVQENISCVTHNATQSACEFADNIYWLDSTLKSCGFVRRVNICHYEESSHSDDIIKYTYKCSFNDCMKFDRPKVIVWFFDGNTQTLLIQDVFMETERLEKELAQVAERSSNNKYNFLFLECSDDSFGKESHDVIAQLLILPPVNVSTKNSQKNEKQPKININIVLLDSAARSHFYRSLPETIKAFNKINQNKKTGDEVLDFKLFQSLEGHTAENIHALFTGTLFPKHWTGADREAASVEVGQLFKSYVDEGYSSFYHDDLCFDEWWGLRLDLGSPKSWDEYVSALDQNFINHTGLSFSSCKILQSNNVTNPFNGPDGPLCFNGKFQDSYLLDFTYIYHESASRNGNSLISFSTLNAAHDNLGRRIQSMDDEFANYVQNIARSSNTLTILFADHGNTYTHYTHAIMEGGFEQYHPAFFMIIPEKVKRTLGGDIMNNLRRNQRKLVTMLDIHHALATIPTNPAQKGLFGSISSKRSCDDLDLRLPNLCVCEGWDAGTLNDTSQVGLLSFAMGELNNKVFYQQRHIRANGSVPKCLRLVPTTFKNVRERSKEGRLITSMDISTTAGEGASQSEDIFHVQIQSNIRPDDASREMILLTFDRVSKYGPYSACADKDVDKLLCVCNIKPKIVEANLKNSIKQDLLQYPILFPTNVEIKRIFKISECLFYRMISYPDLKEDEQDSIFSCSYEVANLCDRSINITLDVTTNNMKTTSLNPTTREIMPYGVTYIAGVIRSVPYWNSQVESVRFYTPMDNPQDISPPP